MDLSFFNGFAAIKRRKLLAIDNKTQAIIARGFTYDDEKFSLSSNAQLNWSVLYGRCIGGDLDFPYSVTTRNDDQYTFNDDVSFKAFCDQAVYAVGYQIEFGRQLKLAVQSCETKEQLNAIVDPRT